MDNVHLFRMKGRSWPSLAVWLGVAPLLALSLVLALGTPQDSVASNTVIWDVKFDQPTTSGKYLPIALGDLNHDGHLDAVAGTEGGGVSAWAGDGAGSWSALPAPATSGAYYGLALGDVDGDGNLDIVGAELDAGSIQIWTGDGKGNWSTMTSPMASGKPYSIALGDINRDGKLDIAAGNGDGAGIEIWTGDGSGTWTPASTGLPISGNYLALAIGDVNRDAHPDLAAASDTGGLRVWEGNWGGSWSEQSSGLPTSGAYNGLALGDLDNDGDLDLAATGGSNQGVQAWTGSGEDSWSWTPASTGLTGSGDFWGIAVGNVDNDGRLDIAAASLGGGVSVWTGDGAGSWTSASAGLPGSGDYFGLALGDLDDDGLPDLVVGSAEDGVYAWNDGGTPDALGGWLAIVSPTTAGLYQDLDVGDFDHDGNLDVVAAGETGGIQLWTGDGGNTWTEISSWTAPDLPTSGNFRAVALGEIEPDGWLDVVAASGEGNGLRAWLFRDESAWFECSSELPDGGIYLDVALADLDGDGILDLVAGGQGLGIGAWTAEDIGTPSPWWDSISAGLPSSGSFPSVAVGDLDNDGLLDIVAGSEGSGLVIWQGDGGAVWTNKPSPVDSGTWPGVALGDVNDDGILDIVAAYGGGEVGVWAGDGAFGWDEIARPTSSDSYSRISLGDYNHDGKLDIAAGSANNTGLAVWAGNGGSAWTLYAAGLATAGDYPAVAFGEIDNDGVLDVLGARYGAGSVHAWTGAEGAPPSGWTNFSPSDWISNTQTIESSIQVRDTGSGLDVDSAKYRFLGALGTWSEWDVAGCTGTDGTTALQTVEIAGVPFGQDSGPGPGHTGNWIQFQVSDVVGNVGYSSQELVYIDTTPPENPFWFDSSPHEPGGECRSENIIWVDWDPGFDASSGVWGYSHVFATSYELPDPVVYPGPSQATSGVLPDGNWYIYVRTRDNAGNWTPDAVSDGPYCIDSSPPTNPTTFTSSPVADVWTNADTIQVNWAGATDTGSGVHGYSYDISEYAAGSADEIPDTTGTSANIPVPHEGDNWYFHIKTVDWADNWTAEAAHYGRFWIDWTDPWFCVINPPTESNSSSFLVPWSCEDALSGVRCVDVQVRDGAGGTWTPWRTCDLGTAAVYTGAQNGHTYYFRIRAHDRAGNVSDYLYEDQTHVLLPPGISGFAPTSGFAGAGQDSAPLQLVPGSTVEINGSALTGGTAYFNGVAMEPSLSQVVNDGQIQAVIAAGTPTGSGPLCVDAPGGYDCAADDFEVVEQPFPVRWGLGFYNFETLAGDMTWGIFEQAFGKCSVNFCPIPMPFVPGRFLPCEWCSDRHLLPRPTALVFYEATRDVADGGDCYGMSYLTLDFLSGRLEPDDFAAGADIPASLACTDPEAGICETPGLANAIRARQWRQTSLEARSARWLGEDTYILGGPMAIHDLVETELENGRWPMLCLSDWDRVPDPAGHCVNPYAVTPNTIRIYDNNHPYIPEGAVAMQRTINVSNGGWSYSGYADNSSFDRDNALYLLPYAVVDGPNTLPSDVERLIFGSSASGHFRVEDAGGGVIGYDESGQYVRTMTGAGPLFPFQDGGSALEGYDLGEPGDYTVYANSADGGSYDLTIFADGGTALVLEGVPLSAGASDAVAFQLADGAGATRAALADGTGFFLTTDDADKNLALTLLRNVDGGSGQHVSTLENLTIGSGASLGLTTQNGGDSLTVTGGAGSTYDVCFYQKTDTQLPAESCWSDVDLQAGDRHILTPEDWDQLSSSRVQLEIDEGNDGSVDDTQWLVGHGLALTMLSEPAVIQSGDQMTYTLAYEVTGGEVAPNVVLTALVPVSTTFAYATGGVVPVDGVLTWTLGNLTPPTGGQVTFIVQVDPVPDDVILGSVAYLRDDSGRWAMASAVSAGPDLGQYNVYLPLVMR